MSETAFRYLYLVVAAVVAFLTGTASAADYYFRPVNIAAYQQWQESLEFVLVNPSNNPVLLNLSVASKGVRLARHGKKFDVLKVEPAQVLLLPGGKKTVQLTYAPVPLSQERLFDVIVEQQPVLFTRPGAPKIPALMTITTYIASIKTQASNKEHSLYAGGLVAQEAVAAPAPVASVAIR